MMVVMTNSGSCNALGTGNAYVFVDSDDSGSLPLVMI